MPSDSRSYTNRNESSGRREDVKKEVQNLFSKRLTDTHALMDLRQKYGDGKTFDAIYEAYKSRQEEIVKIARKFKRVIYDRYNPHSMTLSHLVKKARKWVKKYNIDRAEFDFFVNSVISDRLASGSMSLPYTQMSKTFGHAYGMTNAKLNIPTGEEGVLQEILRLHGESQHMHSQVVLQSLTYKDCGAEAIMGEFKKGTHNSFSYVHPVLAALFIPRIKMLDEHILIANLGNIVKQRWNNRMIETKPEFEVYWDIITDKNDLVCDMESPMKDLRNRYILQTRIWDSVFNLRRGNYFDDRSSTRHSDFMTALDNCRNNIYDAPDLAFVKNEATVLRKILGAFSLRPTSVSIAPLYPVITANPHINHRSFIDIENIPVITYRLPVNPYGGDNVDSGVHLTNAFKQTQWFVEGGTFVPKTRDIIYSRDVIFFHVHRRYQSINLTRLQRPYNFTRLPMTVSSYQTLNTMTVNFDLTIPISSDTFRLRSVVLVETVQVENENAPRGDLNPNNELIVGCSSLIRVPVSISDPARSRVSVLSYDPSLAGKMLMKRDNSGYETGKPITFMEDAPHIADEEDNSLRGFASTRGTIFVYEAVGDQRDLIM